MHVGGDEKHVGALLVRAVRQRHRLGRRRRLVEQRGAGHGQAGEVGDHGLEVHQRLETALRDLGLVGRVGRVPARVLQDVAQDDGRRVRAVVAHADQAALADVALRERAQLGDGGRLVHRRRERGQVAPADRGGDGLCHQRLEAGLAQGAQHLRDLGLGRADVAACELAGVFQLGQLVERAHARVSTKRA